MDFAGGTVVHVHFGVESLVLFLPVALYFIARLMNPAVRQSGLGLLTGLSIVVYYLVMAVLLLLTFLLMR